MNLLFLRAFSAVEDVVLVEAPWPALKEAGVSFRVLRSDHPEMVKAVGADAIDTMRAGVRAAQVRVELEKLRSAEPLAPYNELAAESGKLVIPPDGETEEQKAARLAKLEEISSKLSAMAEIPEVKAATRAIDAFIDGPYFQEHRRLQAAAAAAIREKRRRAMALVGCREWTIEGMPCSPENRLEVFGFDGVAIFVQDEPFPRLMTHDEFGAMSPNDWIAKSIAAGRSRARVYNGGMRGENGLLLRVAEEPYKGRSVSDALLELCLDASHKARERAVEVEEQEAADLGPSPAGAAAPAAG